MKKTKPTANSGYIQVGGTEGCWSLVTFAYLRTGLTGQEFFFAALIYSRGALGASCKNDNDNDNLLQKDRKEKRYNEQPTHKTAHLQTAQTNARPKFAKELFSCRRTTEI